MFLILLLGFMGGIAFTLGVFLLAVLKLSNNYQGSSLPNPIRLEQFSSSVLPKVLRDYFLARKDVNPEQAALGINVLLMFLFQELKNTEKLRSWFKEKIDIELSEIKSNPALQMVLRDIKLDSFDLGNSLPIVRVIKVNTEPALDTAGQLESVDVILDLSYTGEIQLSLEALVSFDRTLTFTSKLLSLAGQGRLRFTRVPYTHWSFSFISEPIIAVDLKSNINGRSIPQIIIPLLINQIKRILRKKHTLPAYKMRVKPFFTELMYNEPRVTERDSGLESQLLEVTVVSSSRLVIDSENNSGIFCLLTVGMNKYLPQLPYEEHLFTVTLSGLPNQRVQGLSLRKIRHNLLKRVVICVDKVKQGSRGAEGGLSKGDVITRVNDVNISVFDVSHIRSLLTDSNSDSVELSVAQYHQSNVDSHHVSPTSSESAISRPELDDVSLSSRSEISSRAERESVRSRNSDSPRSKRKSKSAEREAGQLTSSISSEHIRKSSRIYSTSSVESSGDAEFDEKFNILIESEHVYLNVALFSRNRFGAELTDNSAERSFSDSLVGYASVSIPDILGQCCTNPQGESQLHLSLSAPPDVEYRPPLPGARELDSSSCYGDLTLRFATLASQEDEDIDMVDDVESHGAFQDVDTPLLGSRTNSHISSSSLVSEPGGSDEGSPHVFTEQSFTHAVSCNFCLKKIWFKKAMRCEKCHMIIHRKCESTCQQFTKCNRAIIIESVSSHGTVEHRGRAARLLHKLRKRRHQARAILDNASTNHKDNVVTRHRNLAEGIGDSSSEDGAYTDNLSESNLDMEEYRATDSADVDSSSDDDTAIEYEFMKEYLNKQDKSGAIEESDEMVITAAKQMGKELYSSLDIEERKCKLEAMVDKLQSEIEMVSAVRDEHEKSLKSSCTVPQRQVIKSRKKKADEKMQALAVLLLHYCSGLQDCAEQIEKRKSASFTQTSGDSSEDNSTLLYTSHDNTLSRGDTMDTDYQDAVEELVVDSPSRTRSESTGSSEWQKVSFKDA